MSAIVIFENDGTVSYQLSGVPTTGPLPIDFPYFFADEIIVTKVVAGGVPPETELEPDIDYVLTGMVADDGYHSGSVTLTPALASCTIRIDRMLRTEKATNFPETGAISVPAMNTLFSRLFSLAQQAFRDIRNLVGVPAPPRLDSPEAFGAIGNGIADDSAAIAAWLDYCAVMGIPAIATPGAVYHMPGTGEATIRVPFHGNGATFTSDNNDQTNPMFYVESLDADIEAVSPVTIGAWTRLWRGSRKIPELVERDWCYAMYYEKEPGGADFAGDELVIRRVGDISFSPRADAFDVTSDEGDLSTSLNHDYVTKTRLQATRRRLRPRIQVSGLTIRITTGAVTRSRLVIVQRPHTTLVDCRIRNETAVAIEQGFVHNYCTSLEYLRCRVDGTKPGGTSTTSYGWNGFACDDVVFRNCSASQCRRDIDSHVCSNYKVDGGDFPDGVGGHWLNGLHIYGNAFIGARDPANINCITMSGSNLDVESARIHVDMAPTMVGAPPVSTVLNRDAIGMRPDFPEFRGFLRIGPGVEIVFDETLDTDGAGMCSVVDISMVTYPATSSGPAADSLRTTYLPEIIDIRPGVIRQLGGGSGDNLLRILGMPSLTAAEWIRPMVMPSTIVIEPGAIVLGDGWERPIVPPPAADQPQAAARLAINLQRSDTATGDPCEVTIRNIRRVDVFASGSSAAVTPEGRYDVAIDGIEEPSNLFMRYGAVRRGIFRNVNPGSPVVTAGAALPIGDEAIGFVERWEAAEPLIRNPVGLINQRGSGILVADDTYGSDGWYALTESGNVQTATVGSGSPEWPYMLRSTNQDVGAKRIGIAQIVEDLDCVQWREQSVSLVCALGSSVDFPTPMIVRWAVLEWTGTKNAVVSDVVANWASTSYTAGGFFVATNFIVRGTGSFEVGTTEFHVDPPTLLLGATFNNLVVMLWTQEQVAQNQFFHMAVDLIAGPPRRFTMTRTAEEERALCQRYYQAFDVRSENGKRHIPFIVPMRAGPIMTSGTATVENATTHGFELVDTVAGTRTITATAEL